MATYRITRNIEASIIDYISAQLTSAHWTGISVVKGFEEVYEQKLSLPAIAVRSESSVEEYKEIGDNAEVRNYQVLLNIFATDDGMRLDLKDFLISILQPGCPYYNYVTTKAGRVTSVTSKTQNGRIRVLKIGDTSIKFDVDKDKLVVYDRYRHLLTLTVSRGRYE